MALLESAAAWLWDRGVEQWPPGSMRAQEPSLSRAAQRGELVIARLDCWDGNARLHAFHRDAGFRELEAVPSLGYAVRLFERALDPARREVK